MTKPRNLLWRANADMTTPGGKPHWPAFLTLSLRECDAWELMQALSARLRDCACDPEAKDETTIQVFVGGGNLDPDEG